MPRPRLLVLVPALALGTTVTASAMAAWAGAARTAAASAQTGSKSSQQHAVVTLVAEKSAVVPGQPAMLGLRFEIDPHWHTYWLNPGDSGGPPAIQWKLPPGFEASPFEWPVPQRIPIGQNLMNYGYEADVLLPMTVRVPASAQPGTQAEIAGSVAYLICSDLCVPARAEVHLTLPIAASAGAPSATASVFTQTRARIPKPAPAGWKVSAAFVNHQFELTIDTGQRETGQPETAARFFPLVAGQITDSAPQTATPTARGVRLTLHASDQLTKAPRSLSGVVVLSETRAYTVDAPVASNSK